MIVIKALNNSAALVRNAEDKEEIVLGKGIGFGLKMGDKIDESRIKRRFVLASDQVDFKQLQSIKADTFDLTNQVVQLVEPLLDIKFSSMQYLALADHIDFAITRAKDNIDVNINNTRWEVKNLFPKEFRAANEVINFINNQMDIELPASEMVLMTYHLVNAESDDSQVQETVQITNLINGIISIIQYEYKIELDTDSFNYSRFITHLRALLVRLLRNQPTDTAELDSSLLSFMKIKYHHAYETVERIDKFLNSKMDWELKPDDKFYLVLHIWRVTSRQEESK
ncbi:beta-glucoside operon transcriptional antiterminator [Lactobacillus colini]|uniref:Beta-glucoside operon transcriptional antiterminator n=1 Tax=Lactobacillus colini TaxID=1819254 RepID=A0ABS4MG32_9LACO|nr:PRD domain-containing protein [Lactobacillus colini]MBP2058646.1 beta-glucoside operon transcriptional antiterminator [Lactobacillus colini]